MRSLLNPVAHLVAGVCSHERSVPARLLAVAFGSVMFLAVIPWLLLLVSRPAARWIPLVVPRSAELVTGMSTAAAGLALVAWAVITFWRAGRGTPAPVAAPQRLVTGVRLRSAAIPSSSARSFISWASAAFSNRCPRARSCS